MCCLRIASLALVLARPTTSLLLRQPPRSDSLLRGDPNGPVPCQTTPPPCESAAPEEIVQQPESVPCQTTPPPCESAAPEVIVQQPESAWDGPPPQELVQPPQRIDSGAAPCAVPPPCQSGQLDDVSAQEPQEGAMPFVQTPQELPIPLPPTQPPLPRVLLPPVRLPRPCNAVPAPCQSELPDDGAGPAGGVMQGAIAPGQASGQAAAFSYGQALSAADQAATTASEQAMSGSDGLYAAASSPVGPRVAFSMVLLNMDFLHKDVVDAFTLAVQTAVAEASRTPLNGELHVEVMLAAGSVIWITIAPPLGIEAATVKCNLVEAVDRGSFSSMVVTKVNAIQGARVLMEKPIEVTDVTERYIQSEPKSSMNPSGPVVDTSVDIPEDVLKQRLADGSITAEEYDDFLTHTRS